MFRDVKKEKERRDMLITEIHASEKEGSLGEEVQVAGKIARKQLGKVILRIR